jgi:hypothetical protein
LAPGFCFKAPKPPFPIITFSFDPLSFTVQVISASIPFSIISFCLFFTSIFGTFIICVPVIFATGELVFWLTVPSAVFPLGVFLFSVLPLAMLFHFPC